MELSQLHKHNKDQIRPLGRFMSNRLVQYKNEHSFELWFYLLRLYYAFLMDSYDPIIDTRVLHGKSCWWISVRKS